MIRYDSTYMCSYIINSASYDRVLRYTDQGSGTLLWGGEFVFRLRNANLPHQKEYKKETSTQMYTPF